MLFVAIACLDVSASEELLEPASWSFPEVIEYAREISPSNVEGKPFISIHAVEAQTRESAKVCLAVLREEFAKIGR